MFPENPNASISGPILVPERETYIAMSSWALVQEAWIYKHPRIRRQIGDGLGFPERVSSHYQGEQAEIAPVGSCTQLLGVASLLMRDQPVRFAKDKMLAALDHLQTGQNDAPIKVSRLAHFLDVVVTDLIWTQFAKCTRALLEPMSLDSYSSSLAMDLRDSDIYFTLAVATLSRFFPFPVNLSLKGSRELDGAFGESRNCEKSRCGKRSRVGVLAEG